MHDTKSIVKTKETLKVKAILKHQPPSPSVCPAQGNSRYRFINNIKKLQLKESKCKAATVPYHVYATVNYFK